MTDLSDFIPLIASHVGIDASTLIFYIFVLNKVAKLISRRIPDDATGWKATIRDIAGVVGTDTSSVVTTSPDGKSVTIAEVAAAAAATPPIPEKVEALKEN